MEAFAALHTKHLSSGQTEMVIHASACSNPLFLRTLLEELRSFGNFERLSEHIEACLAQSAPSELFAFIVKRIEV